MEIFNVICELVIPILIFGILFVVGKLIYKKLDNSESRLLNPSEYLPDYEIIEKKPITPSNKELSENNRSRSSKLRIIERVK